MLHCSKWLYVPQGGLRCCMLKRAPRRLRIATAIGCLLDRSHRKKATSRPNSATWRVSFRLIVASWRPDNSSPGGCCDELPCCAQRIGRATASGALAACCQCAAFSFDSTCGGHVADAVHNGGVPLAAYRWRRCCRLTITSPRLVCGGHVADVAHDEGVPEARERHRGGVPQAVRVHVATDRREVEDLEEEGAVDARDEGHHEAPAQRAISS